MRLTVVGCAGSFPRADTACSAYLLEADGFRLLVDLGSGALGALQRHVGLDQVDAVLISHLHADHCLDLCPYAVVRRYAPDAPLPPVPIYGPAGTLRRLTRAYETPPERADLSDLFAERTLAPGRLEIGPFDLTVDRVNHPVETFGVRVRHGNATLAYSADTGPSQALVGLARGADILLCEATFSPRDGNPPNLHLTGAQAGEHAERAGVGQLLLTHLTAWSDRDETCDQAARTFSGSVRVVRDGERWVV